MALGDVQGNREGSMRQIRDLPVDVAWELALHDTWRRANLADANLAGAYLVDANLAVPT